MSDAERESPADAEAAGGFPALRSALEHIGRRAGLARGVRALAALNQLHGFDCPGCAWPDAARRSAVEFCENGAKAVAHETTRARVDAAFFARWPVARLREQSDRWLEAQGRIAEPFHRARGADRFEPVTWERAFQIAGAALRSLASPDEAIFYTSGRASNEAAFLYQLFAREFGTNNLPDCSNLCHESSGTALGEAIGVGKGSVSLEDFERADLIFVIGQNPGSNHPRMLSALQAAKRRGCRIVAINPLRERGLVSFAHPQEPLALAGLASTPIADLYLQVRVGGDIALLQGIMRELLALEAESPGRVLDWDFIRRHTENFEPFRSGLLERDFALLEAQSGIPRAEMREVALRYAAAERVIACWAMGITQHRFGVANVQEIANLLLLRGNIGKPGAGPCPVRGHSNVQGDRTVGITEKPSARFLDALRGEFGFEPPRAHGCDSVAALEAMHAGRARVFVALGGNFAVATPDARYVRESLARCALTVQIATTLNRSALSEGEEALILPCLGRSERDEQASGPQFVTVEDSMSAVHRSEGRLAPAAPALRSEPAIVAGLARAALGAASRVPWEALIADYDRIRERIERVVPGFDDYNRRVRRPGGFVLPSGARTRHFETVSGRARFSVHALPELAQKPGELLLTTIRSHDQFNTTVYSHDDRYRGIAGSRRVVLVNPEDLAAQGIEAGARVDLRSELDGVRRELRDLRAIAYAIPRGCAAAYFPEANALIPVTSFADRSRTPTFKSIPVSLRLAEPGSAPR
jgi:molybdopterin-dependent oxidoreductase alpha subunit